jgi:hypothetical protein
VEKPDFGNKVKACLSQFVMRVERLTGLYGRLESRISTAMQYTLSSGLFTRYDQAESSLNTY